mgnify:CR=1 FL=1
MNEADGGVPAVEAFVGSAKERVVIVRNDTSCDGWQDRRTVLLVERETGVVIDAGIAFRVVGDRIPGHAADHFDKVVFREVGAQGFRHAGRDDCAFVQQDRMLKHQKGGVFQRVRGVHYNINAIKTEDAEAAECQQHP